MQRDILMKLIRIIFEKGNFENDKVRNVIGMNKCFYKWSKQRIFCWATQFQKNFTFSRILKSNLIEISGDGKIAICRGSVLDHSSHIFQNILLGERKIRHGIATVSVKTRYVGGMYRMIGVLAELPNTFSKAFEKESGVLSWGLESSMNGIHSPRGTIVAPSSANYWKGEVVTMTVNVDTGDLEYSVDGLKCAELRGVAGIRRGVFLAVQMCWRDEFEIVQFEEKKENDEEEGKGMESEEVVKN